MPEVSVILCTHNPRADFLQRVLDSLQRQTLLHSAWEFLLIDNASPRELSVDWDLFWHPSARHVREEKLGLTAANLRGLHEAAAETIVFVHDDTVLDPNYLEKALEILQAKPELGAFNGSTPGEYEVPLPSWAKPIRNQLAIRRIEREAWGCLPGTQSLPFAPVGAGMVIRKKVLRHYAHKLETEPLRRVLGRQGASLTSGEDSDMAYCACELGYAVGVFPELSLRHVMPKGRLEKDYLLRLAEGMAFSHAILGYLWDKRMPDVPTPGPLSKSARLYEGYKRWRGKLRKQRQLTFNEEHWQASVAGVKRARDFIRDFEQQQKIESGGRDITLAVSVGRGVDRSRDSAGGRQ